jgi:hypothetical protein
MMASRTAVNLEALDADVPVARVGNSSLLTWANSRATWNPHLVLVGKSGMMASRTAVNLVALDADVPVARVGNSSATTGESKAG